MRRTPKKKNIMGIKQWLKKKYRPKSDYTPYLVAIFALGLYLIFCEVLPLYRDIQKETGFVEILRAPEVIEKGV